MSYSRNNSRLLSTNSYEICIDLMIETQRTIDQIELLIRKSDLRTLDEIDPNYTTLQKHHNNLLSLKDFISEYIFESEEY